MTDQPKYKSIDMTCRMGAAENPTFENAQGWTVRLEYGEPQGERYGEPWRYNMEIPFYMGSAHGMTPPDLETVLGCVFRDDPGPGATYRDWINELWGTEDTATFDEWEARRESYDECVRNAASLRTVLGNDFEAIREEIEGLKL